MNSPELTNELHKSGPGEQGTCQVLAVQGVDAQGKGTPSGVTYSV